MGSLWYIWMIGAVILVVVAYILQSRYRAEARRYAVEEELDRLKCRTEAVREKLASLAEGSYEYRDAREELDALKAEERVILTEAVMTRSKKVEAYECPKCLGEGIDERSCICDFCRGAGIIRADRLYTTGWTWDGFERDGE